MSTVSVPLTQGKVALIDEADYPLVAGYKWSLARRAHTDYAQTWARKEDRRLTCILMHRLLMGSPTAMLVDHRDRNGLNNTRANLRLATHSENHCNSRSRLKNPTGYKGVSWDASKGMWRAQIRSGGVQYHIGRFEDPEEAARAYDRQARVLHGDFARLNFPD